jgi:predicted secreted protein
MVTGFIQGGFFTQSAINGQIQTGTEFDTSIKLQNGQKTQLEFESEPGPDPKPARYS